MASGNNMEYLGLEYLRKATVVKMKRVGTIDSIAPNKIFEIITTNSKTFCCTEPNSNDLIIRDDKYGMSRFVIQGDGFHGSHMHIFIKPGKSLAKVRNQVVYLNDGPKVEWKQKMMADDVIHEKDGNSFVYNIRMTDHMSVCASITVEAGLVIWNITSTLPVLFKAALIALGISYIVDIHRHHNTINSHCMESLLWCDETQPIPKEQEAEPIIAPSKLTNVETMTLRPHAYQENNQVYSFVLTDESNNNNVLLMIYYFPAVSGYRLNDIYGNYHYMVHGAHRLNSTLIHGPLGNEVATMTPPKDGSKKGWLIHFNMLNDSNPNKQLRTDYGYEDYGYNIRNSLNEVVCTFTQATPSLKIKLKKSLGDIEKAMLVSCAVKNACQLLKYLTAYPTPVVKNLQIRTQPSSLIRQCTSELSDFPAMYTKFKVMKSIHIRPAFRIEDENVFYFTILDFESRKLLYILKCKTCAGFEVDVMDTNGNLAFFVHQPHNVETTIVSRRQSGNIGTIEEKSILTDDGAKLGEFKLVDFHQQNRCRKTLAVINDAEKIEAQLHSPMLTSAILTVNKDLRADQKILLAAFGIFQTFHTFRLHEDIPCFPTLSHLSG